MNELYIVRHGIAVEPGTPGMLDDDRPLTPKGERRVREIARGLAKLEPKLDRIVTSPLPRARRTAEIVADVLKIPPRLFEISTTLKAGHSAATIVRWLDERTEDRLMIVGHNPAVSELVSVLVHGTPQPAICELKKGGVAALSRMSVTQDVFELSWVATPRLIRRLANGHS
jgi:phosphohistidine phosphatase